MDYKLRNIDIFKFCAAFMICFILTMTGITNVFADDTPKITQATIDKGSGVRLDEGDSVKISVKAEGATSVRAYIKNNNSYHYRLNAGEFLKKYVRNVEMAYNDATGEYEYTFTNNGNTSSGKWCIEKFILKDNAGKSHDIWIDDLDINVYVGGMIEDLVFTHFMEWNPVSKDYEDNVIKSVQRGTLAEDLGSVYQPAQIDGLNFIKWTGQGNEQMNDDQFNYVFPVYDKKIIRVFTFKDDDVDLLLGVQYALPNEQIDLSQYKESLKNYDVKWYYYGSEYRPLTKPVEINDMYTVNESGDQIIAAFLTPNNGEPEKPQTPEEPQAPEVSQTPNAPNVQDGTPSSENVVNTVQELNTEEEQITVQEAETEEIISPKTGENRTEKIIITIIILCMACVIYIVRKRELYEK